MDRTNDLILGVLGGTWCGFRYPGVEAYLVSIQRSGFTGRKVMICWGIRPEVKAKLIEFGFELVELPSPPDSFFHARMRVCWEYLRDHYQEFRYIFWLDIKDLVLQANPSVWMEKNIGNSKIIASTECVPIQHEETNKLWAQTILGEKKYQEIKNEEVINGGTWAGESEIITEVFHQVHLGCATYSGPYPPCQININWTLRQEPFKEVLSIPRWSEGFAACLHPCWSPWRTPCWPYMRDPHPTLDVEDCVLYPGVTPDSAHQMIPFNNMTNVSMPWAMDKGIYLVDRANPLQGIECKKGEGSPFAIVHGFDRDWGIKALFEYKYRFGEHEYNFERAKSEFNNAVVLSTARKTGRLRRPSVQPALSVTAAQAPRVFKRNP